MPAPAARRTVLQKVRGCAKALPQFVNTGFQVLFHSPPGVLFTFPSQYYALSVTKKYLALRGGPRFFHQDFSCPGVLRIPLCRFRLRIRGFHPLWPAFPKPFSCLFRSRLRSIPRSARATVWAPPVSLAATPGIDVSFSSSGYLDVSVHRVPFRALWIGARIHRSSLCGFPHSEIHGSADMCSSPRLIAAYHVFHRLLVPRHPPCALFAWPVLFLPAAASAGGMQLHGIKCHASANILLLIIASILCCFAVLLSQQKSDLLLWFYSRMS